MRAGPVDHPAAGGNDLPSHISAGALESCRRLVGKRFLAKYFVESAYDETHGCNYLLAIDIDMEPVPGYKAANWEMGYGDFVVKPDLSTIRRIPWLEKTALVMCDIQDHKTHEDLPHSPRGILKRQMARLKERGWLAYFSKGHPVNARWDLVRYAEARIARHLRRRSQRPYRPPEGTNLFQHAHDLGLIALQAVRG